MTDLGEQKCACCGQAHDGYPMAYATGAPVYWYGLPEKRRKRRILSWRRRSFLDEELCVINGEHFFIWGRVLIPVLDGRRPFEWGVWVSLSETNFKRTLALWEQPSREDEPLYFGWLSTSLPLYPDTLNLQTMAYTQPVGERPVIELEPTDHPLAVEQRNDITMARVREIAEHMLLERGARREA